MFIKTHEVQHPRWGSNLANQLTAEQARDYGKDGKGHVVITTVPRVLFPGTKQKKTSYEWIERPATDEDVVRREFHHRCGLLKIVLVSSRDRIQFTAFLDGHVTSNFVSSEIEFRFAANELEDNGGKPTAEVWFAGSGPRRGPLEYYGTSRLVCTFADQEQMNQYLDLTSRRALKSVTYKGTRYDVTPAGSYQSGDGSSLPLLVAMYLLLSPSEQRAFAAQNPEVQSLADDTADDSQDTEESSGNDADFEGGADMGGGDVGGGGDTG